MIFGGMSPLEIRSTYSAVTLIGPTKASISLFTPPTSSPQPPANCFALPRVCSLPSWVAWTSVFVSRSKAVHHIDAGVEVVLDLVEVAVVGVGDLRRDVALGDPVHIFGRDVDRGHEGVDQLVDAAHQLAPAAGELLRVAAGLQLAVLGRLDQRVRLPQQPFITSMQALRLFLISLKSPL